MFNFNTDCDMKRFLYLLPVLMLVLLAGCGGDDEPKEAGNIACQAYLKDGGTASRAEGVFFLFEGTGYKELDFSTYEAFPIQKIKAVKSNGSKVENIGWCTSSKNNSGLIVPTYSSTDQDRLSKIQSGTFTIVCLMGLNSMYHYSYMMKEFTKKKTEVILVSPVFQTSDFSKTNTTKVPWRE